MIKETQINYGDRNMNMKSNKTETGKKNNENEEKVELQGWSQVKLKQEKIKTTND